MDKSKIEYLEFYKAELGNGKHCTKSFGLAVWQHQQAKVEELEKEWLEMNQQHEQAVKECFEVNAENRKLQKRVDKALELMQKPLIVGEPSSYVCERFKELEQALKGEGK
ncbi:hypothetical protein [Acinetobacter nosocomialis]|uniref:hypothetical protein n=1 Tax=Acinetobacter nosocomialis TaxID=106654 RepID=UPI001D1896B9|nr:hypothetical protein [Acinetobacter nosocomialis]